MSRRQSGATRITVAVGLSAALLACGGAEEAGSAAGAPGGAESPAADAEPEPGVVVNGTALTEAQLGDIEARYGVRPKPGEYWYDARSGLYGVVGYPSFGFMYPGHSFGPLKPGASDGDTGVVVNGRELPQQEWAVWSQIIGTPIQPGRYWFDANGNAGYEGNPMPTVNFFLAAQQNAYRSAGGDNLWSSRFGAGNSNAGNTQGYVSVPGYGPIGYGF